MARFSYRCHIGRVINIVVIMPDKKSGVSAQK